MRLLVAVLLVAIGAAQISATKKVFKFGPFKVRSEVGQMPKPYPQTKNDMLASEKAVQHLEFFRRFMHTGIGHVPPMDPYTEKALHHLVFDGSKTDFKGTVLVSNLEVMGASKVTVKNLKVFLNTKRMDFSLHVPKIAVRAHFEAVNVMVHGLQFNTSGEMEIAMEDYDVSGAVSVEEIPWFGHRWYRSGAVVAEVAASSGTFSSSVEIGAPSEKDLTNVRQMVYDAVATAFLDRLTTVLRGYSADQVDRFMQP